MVTVDYINADYDKLERDGFQKRTAPGYNGSSARPIDRIGKDDLVINDYENNSDDDNLDGAYEDGPKQGATIGDLNVSLPNNTKKKPISDERIRDMMLNDPNAGKFLEGMLEGNG